MVWKEMQESWGQKGKMQEVYQWVTKQEGASAGYVTPSKECLCYILIVSNVENV